MHSGYKATPHGSVKEKISGIHAKAKKLAPHQKRDIFPLSASAKVTQFPSTFVSKAAK